MNLAAQTLSASVADDLEYCGTKLKDLSISSGCLTTCLTLNSRNPFAKGKKSPMRKANEDSWCPFLVKARKYILGLQDERGTPIMKTRRKTGFLGFLCCIDSVQALYDRLVAADDGPLRYILTYKMSQDHLELFFAAVRACGRWKNCQSVHSRIQATLMRHNVEATNGNCGKQDSTAVLEVPVGVGENRAITTDANLTEHEVNDVLMRHKVNDDGRNTVLETAVLDVIRRSATVNGKQLMTHDVQIDRQCDLLPSIQLEDCMVDMPPLPANPMSMYKHAVVAYIAGFVCLMAKKRLSCDICKDQAWELSSDPLISEVF